MHDDASDRPLTPATPATPAISGPELDDEVLDALLASDLAAEVRTLFNDQREAGQSVAAATKAVLGQFGHALSSPHEGPVVLLVIAALQQKAGRLSVVFRDIATDLIDSGEASAAFPTDAGDVRRLRRQLLDRFRDTLQASPVDDATLDDTAETS